MLWIWTLCGWKKQESLIGAKCTSSPTAEAAICSFKAQLGHGLFWKLPHYALKISIGFSQERRVHLNIHLNTAILFLFFADLESSGGKKRNTLCRMSAGNKKNDSSNLWWSQWLCGCFILVMKNKYLCVSYSLKILEMINTVGF